MHNNTIEKGYYKHFKHDLLSEPKGNNFLYEVLGVSMGMLPDSQMCVVYRPLYPHDNEQADFFSRPILDFTGKANTKNGIKVNRFQLITDADEIERLNRVREEMYGKK